MDPVWFCCSCVGVGVGEMLTAGARAQMVSSGGAGSLFLTGLMVCYTVNLKRRFSLFTIFIPILFLNALELGSSFPLAFA